MSHYKLCIDKIFFIYLFLYHKMSITNTDYKVNNRNYSNKDLAEIFSSLSPYGIKIIYGDFWTIPSGSEDTSGNYSGWYFYGSGGRNDVSGDVSFPGQVVLYTGGSGEGVSGINYPYETLPNEIVFIIQLEDSSVIQNNTLLYAGIGITTKNEINPVNSAYIGVKAFDSVSYFFHGFINGVEVTERLREWEPGKWYYLNIKIDREQQEITFAVTIAGSSPESVSVTVPFKTDVYEFRDDILYYTLFEIREPSARLNINIDYIGFSYQASRTI
jgi:hypothetical protein